jgi:2-polyprenyl-3-methyl-5-hydroxy-6-metoxy-1,4-benzoquinol methylase
MRDYLYPHLFKIEKEHWWFAARQQILLNYLMFHIKSPQKLRLLDVGCGTGALLELLSTRFDAAGIDTSPGAIEFCHKRGLTNTSVGDLASYPGSATFDIITLLDVIEHIEDDVEVLRQASRLLRNDGHVLITVPAFPFLWSVHDEVTHHKRRYVRSTLLRAVTSAGLRVQHLTFFNTLLFPVACVRRVLARLSASETADDLEMPAGPVNTILRRIFELEKQLVPRTHLPVGLSLLCLASKVYHRSRS